MGRLFSKGTLANVMTSFSVVHIFQDGNSTEDVTATKNLTLEDSDQENEMSDIC